jgi:ribosomal protein L17
MDDLVKSLNRVENYTAKYIFNKYINNTTNTSENINKNKEYKQFIDNIFGLERKAIITQDESLNEDLDNMDLADKVFEKAPEKFKRRDYDSLPDVKRCTFIRKYKNKYIRCAMSITDDGNDDNSDVCYKHESSVNMYWDNYSSFLKKSRAKKQEKEKEQD